MKVKGIPEGWKSPHSQKELTLKEKTAINEYIKTGNKSAAIRAAYSVKPEHAGVHANTFFKKPKIVDALKKALKDTKFDDAYAVETLKKIVDGGMENIDITRPDTSLKALETYFKITNRMGGGNKEPMRIDPETAAKKMDMSQLTAALKEMDKRQKRIFDILKNGNQPPTEEGEVLNED